MDNRPIGVFDSGVGGLSCVRELRRLLPRENIVYLGDTGRVPYGTRSRETIRRYSEQDMRFLLSHGVKAIIAACGTVSANFSSQDAHALAPDIPFTGVVSPASRAACAASKGGRIGVIATPAAVSSGAYEREIHAIAPAATVVEQACPLLVPLVENGLTDFDNKITRLTLELYLAPICDKIDTLILGCTHYPLLYDIIDDMLGGAATLIDAGAQAAATARDILARQDLFGGDAHTAYYVTDAVDGFLKVAEIFLDEIDGGDVHYINPEAMQEML